MSNADGNSPASTDTNAPSSEIALPSGSDALSGAKRRRRRRRRLVRVTIAILIGAVIAVAIGLTWSRRIAVSETDKYTVRRERLEPIVVERGTLESADSCDVFCSFKPNVKNGTAAITIKSIIDNGSQVHKGDLLVDLDDSVLIEQFQAAKATLNQAESAKIQSEEQYKITVSQNESNTQSAENKLEEARIDLRKYQKADYPQSLRALDGRIKTAESDVEQQKDRIAWAKRMQRKGYMTMNQLRSEWVKLDNLELALAKVKEEKDILNDPDFGLKKRTETGLLNKVTEAERALRSTQLQALSKEITSRIERAYKQSIYLQELAKCHNIEEEIKKCKIYAPQDGIVVYNVPEQTRTSGGESLSVLAQGEPIHQGQKLMQIAKLSHLLVNTPIPEAMASSVKSGQPAQVCFDAFPDRQFPAHVDVTTTNSAQQDFRASDIKIHTARVILDGEVAGLKPGMQAEVKIALGNALERVLTVPIEAIVNTAGPNTRRRCMVQTPTGPKAREIVVGLNDGHKAEILEGLREGEEVVLNPKTRVGNKTKVYQSKAESEIEEKLMDTQNDPSVSNHPDKGVRSPAPGTMTVPRPPLALP